MHTAGAAPRRPVKANIFFDYPASMNLWVGSAFTIAPKALVAVEPNMF